MGQPGNGVFDYVILVGRPSDVDHALFLGRRRRKISKLVPDMPLTTNGARLHTTYAKIKAAAKP